MTDSTQRDPRMPSSDEPLPDAGEPQGANDDRPTMLGRRFRLTVLSGSAIGLVLALVIHYLITQTVEDSTKFNGWSWALAAIGGITVGGALSLFTYGAATDRTDVGEHRRGQADVTTQGESKKKKKKKKAERRGGAGVWRGRR